MHSEREHQCSTEVDLPQDEEVVRSRRLTVPHHGPAEALHSAELNTWARSLREQERETRQFICPRAVSPMRPHDTILKCRGRARVAFVSLHCPLAGNAPRTPCTAQSSFKEERQTVPT